MPIYRAMFTRRYEIVLLKNRSQPPPTPCSAIGTPAGLHHGVPQEGDHRPSVILATQGGNSTEVALFTSP
jgi:hypothetical protein